MKLFEADRKGKLMRMNKFVQERDRALTEFVKTGDTKAVWKYCRKYGVKIPENEQVFKAGIYKAVQKCRGIPQEVKDLAAVKCVELGFSPTIMTKDINKTLMAIVPILRMNGEMVKSIEAVNDWYKVGDREYLKEVAEITYDNGTRRYADIGCGSNLTAVYDVVAVIQQIQPRSSDIERIERGVYRQYPIESIPSAADVRPVVRGHWEESPMNGIVCSECGRERPLEPFGETEWSSDFCPWCGADMRGEENE